jgi:hypothetical protein
MEAEAQKDFPQEPGAWNYVQAFLFSPGLSGERDYNQPGFLMQVWQTEGSGGGNHWEQYITMFRVYADGTVDKRPLQEEQVGEKFKGAYDFDLNKVRVSPEFNAVSASAPVHIVAPGCSGRCLDFDVDRTIAFCGNNRRRLFVSGEVYDKERWIDFDAFLGVTQSEMRPRSFTLPQTSAAATDFGVQPGQRFFGWQVQVNNPQRAALSGIRTGDILFSVRGRVASSWSDFQCSMMDGEDDYGEVHTPFSMGVVRNNTMLGLTFRPPQQ